MSVTITLHVWRLRPLGHRAMWSGWIVLSLNFHLGQCFHKRVPFELWYTNGDQIRVYGWYDVPIEGHINIGWMSWESLRQFRASSLSSPQSLIASMVIYVDHDEARTSEFTSWSGVTLCETIIFSLGSPGTKTVESPFVTSSLLGAMVAFLIRNLILLFISPDFVLGTFPVIRCCFADL